MKDNFEHIKNLVENFEVEYDPKAWDNLSKKMDQLPKSSAKSNLSKYLWSGAAVAAISIGTFTYLSNNTDKKNNPAEKVTIVNRPQADQNNNVIAADNQTTNNTTKDIPTNTNQVNSNTANHTNVLTNESTFTPIVHANEGHDKGSNVFVNYEKSILTNPTPSLKLPHIKNACLNETIQIKNDNNCVLYIHHGNERVAQIDANKTISLELKHSGEYTISGSDLGQGFIDGFMVYNSPKTNFNYSDEINYESGLPILNAQTEEMAQTYEWKLDGKTIGNQKSISFPAFYKGDLNLTLELSNQYGCTSSDTKKIEVEENYNLLAVNAFEPNNANPKKNAFMPYALTKRDVKFNLIIIDPTSGAVIFESSDPTNPWTGINKSTGQMMPNNKSYIWKVSLMQAAKGEKTEYRGMITLL